MSLYKIPSQLYTYLSNYKRSTNQAVRSDFSRRVIAMLVHFLDQHRSCIESMGGGPWETITNVPSTKSSGEHPLVSALRLVPRTFAVYDDLLKRGPAQVTHLVANDDGFEVVRKVAGERVLLIDDTYTSGARAQSAASALSIAGAEVVAIVPAGRVIDPSFSSTVDAYWQRQTPLPFDFTDCAVH